MMKSRIYIALCVAFVLMSFNGDVKLVKQKITKNITVGIPQTFHEMTDDEIAGKYFTYRRPIKMFADASNKVNFGINLSETPWQPDDIQMLFKVYKSNILNTYSNIRMMRQEVIKLDGKAFAIFEFLGRLDGDAGSAIMNQGALTQYHYLAYSTMGHQVAIFNFNCGIRYHQVWRKTADQMIRSIKITAPN